MKKWSYLVLIVGWTLSMVYEALFVPSLAGLYALMAGLLDVVPLSAFRSLRSSQARRKRRRSSRVSCGYVPYRLLSTASLLL